MVPVLITWKDSHSWDEWKDRSDATKRAKDLDCTVITTAFLLEETDDRFIVCRSRTADDSLVDGVQIILKSSVVRKVNLREGNLKED